MNYLFIPSGNVNLIPKKFTGVFINGLGDSYYFYKGKIALART